jgi:hypothetical protein
VPLTDKAIKNAKPSNKRVRLFDERALYLEVSPAGGKWWRLKYRFDGKEKRLSLGVYPDISLKAARDRRDAARKLLSDGIDPAAHRVAVSQARAEGPQTGSRSWRASFTLSFLPAGLKATLWASPEFLSVTSTRGSAQGRSRK